jgi:alanine racemase
VSRATRATISTAALEHNLAALRRRASGARVMAVIKANAYGHGLAAAARGLRAADAFAVASAEEASAVRAAGLSQPVVLLEGAFGPEDIALASRDRFELVVHSPEQLAMLEASSGPPLALWLKVDTGMHRLGFAPSAAREAHARLSRHPRRQGPVGLMTHLARADEPEAPGVDAQLAAFAAFDDLPGPRSIANSAAALALPRTHADWIRPGLALYGMSPFPGRTGAEEGLRPAMSLQTTLIAVRTVRVGESVGYGARWTAREDTPVGIAAIGYGDGFPRHAPDGMTVLVDGAPAPLVGRVSMDLIARDLRGLPRAAVGAPVELWGAVMPIERVARAAGTIPYELSCGVAQRVRYEVV